MPREEPVETEYFNINEVSSGDEESCTDSQTKLVKHKTGQSSGEFLRLSLLTVLTMWWW